MNLPISYNAQTMQLTGATEAEIRPFYETPDTIRRIERASIRQFMEDNQSSILGRTLDFGAGLQPYRDLVNGEYVPFEKNDGFDFSANSFDTIICNQVVQYIPSPRGLIRDFWRILRNGGNLILTFPTNWDEVEPEDLHRLTFSGMSSLLRSECFHVRKSALRAQVRVGNFNFPLGYGIVAQPN